MKKIIITGNLGKTTFAYYLAEHLSKTKKVVLISTDENKAVYRCLFPKTKKSEKSLARLLCDPVIVDKDIFNNSHLINKRFLMISNADTKTTYPEATIVNCGRLFMALETLTDIVIVDSSANHIFDNYFKNTENCLNVSVLTADIRGYHYRLKHGNGDIDLLWEASNYSAYQDSINTFRKKPFSLPFVKNLMSIYNTENISDITVAPKYLKTIKEVATKIAEMEGDDVGEEEFEADFDI